MERAERTFPATTFLTALVESYQRLLSAFGNGHETVYAADEEIAFTDEFERELIRRELHPF